MISKLTISNFQNHDSTTIEFDRQITVIVGPNGAGKSAILRALRWACFNRPTGDSFIRWGQKQSKVSITVDSHLIERIKRSGSNSKNLYTLDGLEFKAFGTGIPDEIRDVLQLGEDNFQRQHDAPFWFSMSPGQVSIALNRIVDLGIIDKTVHHLSKRVRHCRSKVEVARQERRRAHSKVTSLEWVEEAGAKLEAIKSMERDGGALESKGRALSLLIHRGQEFASRIERSKGILQDSNSLLDVGSRLQKSGGDSKRLQELISKAQHLQKSAEEPDESANLLEKALSEFQVARIRKRKLHALIIKATELKDIRREAERNLRILEKKLGSNCPTCGAKLT